MLDTALLWYRKFRTDLEEIGFMFNEYDACTAAKNEKGSHHLIRFHVDDVLSSHVLPQVNDQFYNWEQKKYGAIKEVEVKRGKKFQFLRKMLDFSVPGECHVIQDEHIGNIINSFPEKFQKTQKELTPCASNHYDKGKGGLSEKEKEMFHSIVAQALFVSNRSRPDILPTVVVLSSRVRNPNEDDWKKLGKLVRYLNNTMDLHLVPKYDDVRITR